MKILFFSRRFHPLIGGVEKHVLEIGQRLVKKGHKVVVITEKLPQLSEKSEINGITIIRINAGKNGFFKKFRIWMELIKYLSLVNRSEVIHCHDVFFWYLPFRFLLPLKKVYTTFHGYEGNSMPSKKAILMHKISEKLSYGNICVGDFLKKWYGTKPSFVIYGGVSEKLLVGKSEKSSKDILFLGRLEEETGILKYLETLKLLKEKGLNLSLDIFGDGNIAPRAKKFALQNNLKVSFKGFVNNPEKFLQDYKYIFVSRYLGILEAIAAKRPVFAEYNNEIKKDYLKLTPFAKYISISKNSEEIANDLINLMNKKTNLDIKRAYDWVKNNSWSNITDLYLSLWLK